MVNIISNMFEENIQKDRSKICAGKRGHKQTISA